MRKKLFALLSLGLMIIVTWSFLGTRAEQEVPSLSVGDQWTYGWYEGEFTNDTEVGEYLITVTVDRKEDFEGVSCYVCIYEYPSDEHENRTNTVWMTSEWVILKTEEFIVYDFAETRITFIWNPGLNLYDFPLTIGKEWSERSYRTIEQYWYDYAEDEEEIWTGEVDYIDWLRRVVSIENVTSPMGTFDVYVVEGFGADDPLRGIDGERFYFSSDVKNYVKMEFPGESVGGQVLTNYKIAQINEQENLPLVIILPTALGVLVVTFFIYNRRNHRRKNL